MHMKSNTWDVFDLDTCEEFRELSTFRISGLQCPISDFWYDTNKEDFLVE